MVMTPQVTIRDAISLNGEPLAGADLQAATFWEWQPVELACPPQPHVVAAHLIIAGSDLGTPATAFGDPTWRWRWLPRDAVGVFDARLILTFADQQRHEETFHIRIRPRTIDSEQYEALMEATQREAAALVYALHGGAEGARLGGEHARSVLEDYAVLVEQLGPAAAALTDEIVRQPHHTLRSERRTLPLADVERFDQSAIAAVAHTPPDAVSSVHGAAYNGPLPHTVTTHRSTQSTDVVEHGLLKGVLHTLVWRVGVVRAALAKEAERRAQHDAVRSSTAAAVARQRMGQCATVQRALRRALAAPFLADVKPLVTLREPTHLMRRAPRYRRVYDLYRALRHAPLIDWDSPTLWLPIQSLPLLYEQWCALHVLNLIMGLGSVVEQRLLTHTAAERDQRRWTLRLRQNAPLLTVACSNGVRLRVFYQRRYGPQHGDALGSLDPFVRIPDIAIEVEQDDRPTHVLLLDAKYRVDHHNGVPQDALDDAYAYRHAIGAGGQRRTLGAFLLYPGDKQIHAADNVGALPCLPMNNEQLSMIKELLSTK